MITHFQSDCIIDIKARGDNSYAKSDKDEHWIWGDNNHGQLEPIMIQHTFVKQNGRKIKSVYLALDSIYIVGKSISS